MKDALGDRIKLFEEAANGERLNPNTITIARMDGRAFHSFTKGLNHPFDTRMSEAMYATLYQLAVRNGAEIGYKQSDEITLVWNNINLFGRRYFKLISALAAEATLFFYRAVLKTLPAYADKLPSFDARIFQVPSEKDALDVLKWRQEDAKKNSINGLARAYFKHNELHGRSCEEKLSMLLSKGVDWNTWPETFKNGTFLIKKVVEYKFPPDEIKTLPPKHAARVNPDLVFTRNVYSIAHDLPEKLFN